ncbi:hypothetical protein L204_105225 [Cryptococcus depauperatus]|nr:hypothetical protein L204_03875 [Cryptococcus depauperatus CBS 7855]
MLRCLGPRIRKRRPANTIYPTVQLTHPPTRIYHVNELDVPRLVRQMGAEKNPKNIKVCFEWSKVVNKPIDTPPLHNLMLPTAAAEEAKMLSETGEANKKNRQTILERALKYFRRWRAKRWAAAADFVPNMASSVGQMKRLSTMRFDHEFEDADQVIKSMEDAAMARRTQSWVNIVPIRPVTEHIHTASKAVLSLTMFGSSTTKVAHGIIEEKYLEDVKTDLSPSSDSTQQSTISPSNDTIAAVPLVAENSAFSSQTIPTIGGNSKNLKAEELVHPSIAPDNVSLSISAKDMVIDLHSQHSLLSTASKLPTTPKDNAIARVKNANDPVTRSSPRTQISAKIDTITQSIDDFMSSMLKKSISTPIKSRMQDMTLDNTLNTSQQSVDTTQLFGINSSSGSIYPACETSEDTMLETISDHFSTACSHITNRSKPNISDDSCTGQPFILHGSQQASVSRITQDDTLCPRDDTIQGSATSSSPAGSSSGGQNCHQSNEQIQPECSQKLPTACTTDSITQRTQALFVKAKTIDLYQGLLSPTTDSSESPTISSCSTAINTPVAPKFGFIGNFATSYDQARYNTVEFPTPTVGGWELALHSPTETRFDSYCTTSQIVPFETIVKPIHKPAAHDTIDTSRILMLPQRQRTIKPYPAMFPKGYKHSEQTEQDLSTKAWKMSSSTEFRLLRAFKGKSQCMKKAKNSQNRSAPSNLPNRAQETYNSDIRRIAREEIFGTGACIQNKPEFPAVSKSSSLSTIYRAYACNPYSPRKPLLPT